MKHILVVDDYKPFLDEIRQTVADEGISISTAESSRDAISQIHKKHFDLVITDLFMETKTADDGLSVLRAAKENEFTQVIVITAYGGPQLSVQTMQLGAFDYLERTASGIHFRAMLSRKMQLALDYGRAKLMIAEHAWV